MSIAVPYKNEFYEKYQSDQYSQNGEDGVIAEILRRLNITSGYVCEFGAWDGIHLSNTFQLIKEGFNAVLIEGVTERYWDLLATQKKYPTIKHAINAFVDHDPHSENSLDNLLKTTDIPLDFDLLSIDIDSYDYQVWKSLETYRPKIVVIEIQSDCWCAQDVNHIYTKGKCTGSSFAATLELGKQKGYTFAVHTGNMIFVRDDLFEQLGIHYEHPLENFRRNWV